MWLLLRKYIFIFITVLVSHLCDKNTWGSQLIKRKGLCWLTVAEVSVMVHRPIVCVPVCCNRTSWWEHVVEQSLSPYGSLEVKEWEEGIGVLISPFIATLPYYFSQGSLLKVLPPSRSTNSIIVVME
jgi:hypothetical protein